MKRSRTREEQNRNKLPERRTLAGHPAQATFVKSPSKGTQRVLLEQLRDHVFIPPVMPGEKQPSAGSCKLWSNQRHRTMYQHNARSSTFQLRKYTLVTLNKFILTQSIRNTHTRTHVAEQIGVDGAHKVAPYVRHDLALVCATVDRHEHLRGLQHGRHAEQDRTVRGQRKVT